MFGYCYYVFSCVSWTLGLVCRLPSLPIINYVPLRLGGATCLSLLVEHGLMLFTRALSRQGSSHVAPLCVMFEEHLHWTSSVRQGVPPYARGMQQPRARSTSIMTVFSWYIHDDYVLLVHPLWLRSTSIMTTCSAACLHATLQRHNVQSCARARKRRRQQDIDAAEFPEPAIIYDNII